MRKAKFLAIPLLVAGLLAVNGTLAWLTQGASITNEFISTDVEGEIKEEFDEKVKENVSVHNSGDIDVYIRVVLVPNWLDKDGNLTMLTTDNTYELSINTETDERRGKWIKKNGFYYYTKPVPPGEETAVLITSCKPNVALEKTEYRDKTFRMDVVAQLIQAQPVDAVKDSWKVTMDADGITIKE